MTLSSLADGFHELGHLVEAYDPLNKVPSSLTTSQLQGPYDYLLGYDYSAVSLKHVYTLPFTSINYFSDDITSDFIGKEEKPLFENLKKADNYTFYWDNVLTNALKKEISQLYYLPHCVNTNVYRPLLLEKTYDVVFCGRLFFHGQRIEYILSLLEADPRLKLGIFSFPNHLEQALEGLSPAQKRLLRSCYKGFIETEQEMAKVLNQAKIVINFTQQGIGCLNYRVFQTLACETFLVTDVRQEINTLFVAGKDIIAYDTKETFLGYVFDYLKSPEKYQEIIRNGRKTVVEKYSSELAARKILDTIAAY